MNLVCCILVYVPQLVPQLMMPCSKKIRLIGSAFCP